MRLYVRCSVVDGLVILCLPYSLTTVGKGQCVVLDFIIAVHVAYRASGARPVHVNALLLANSTFQIVHTIGMPEARIPLAECTIYLASSAKSNSAYMAINEALAVAKDTQMASVPLYLRNAPTKLMEELGYADGYKYAHDYPGHFADLEFMPAELAGHKFYEPAENKHEEALRSRLESLWPKYYK